MSEPLDLSAVAAGLVAAKERASALPYRVDFEPDAERGLLIARSRYGGHGMAFNSAKTGRTLADVIAKPDEAFDYMFGFLDACYRG